MDLDNLKATLRQFASAHGGNAFLTRGRFQRAVVFHGNHALVCTLLLAWVVPFGEWSLEVPFDNWGDGLFLSTDDDRRNG